MTETPNGEEQCRHIETDSSLAMYIAPTPTVESDHPDIAAFAAKYTSGVSDPVEAAMCLYYAVRDGIRYDPYTISFSVESLKASQTLQGNRGQPLIISP